MNIKQAFSPLSGVLTPPSEIPLKPESPLSAKSSASSEFALEQAQDLFFRFLPIEKTNFNKRFPYQMRILDVKSGQVVSEFTFPLNPSNISIQVPSATVLEATMKGVYETHNGAPFRPISIAGTTGTNVIPKAIAAGPQGSDGGDLRRSLEYAFKNSIKAVNGVVDQANRTVSAFSGGTQRAEGPLNYKVTELADLHTGYESIHDLERFLDYYLAGKKLKKNKSWRLYFLMHKDQSYYACSLVNYSIMKAAGTTEYQYQINLNAYRKDAKIPGQSPVANSLATGRAASNTLSNVLNGLRQARATVASAHRVLSGIRNDINESFITPIGETVLLAKDLLGLGKSMYDFAFSGETTKAMTESFKQYFTDNKDGMQSISAAVGRLGLVGTLATNGKPQSALDTSAQDKLSSGLAEQFQENEDSSDPVGVLFDNPADHPTIFEDFPIDDMNLSVEITNQLDQITNDALSMTAEDIINRRNTIADFARSVSEALGGGDATYNRVKGQNSVRSTYKKLSVDDIILLSQMNDIVMQMDSLAALLDTSAGNDAEDYYRFYSDYAISAGLTFNSTNLSRFFIPFPMGATLEQLATQYLGSPQRWIEIAALNALKSPYVDEVGYDIPVTASSGGDTLTVSNSQELYIGQIVRVQSDVVRSTVRKIRSIDIVNSIETIITFEASDKEKLTLYKPSANARIHAFMPNTVNSDMLIAIPSEAQPTFNTTFKTSPEVNELDAITRSAKVDLLLDSGGDLIFTGGGEVKMAYGLTNLIQAAMMIIKTNANTLLQNPAFGNPVDAGISVADVTAQDILKALTTAFEKDPRFTGILAGEVQINGPAVVVSLLLGVTNTDVSLPVQAEIPR